MGFNFDLELAKNLFIGHPRAAIYLVTGVLDTQAFTVASRLSIKFAQTPRFLPWLISCHGCTVHNLNKSTEILPS